MARLKAKGPPPTIGHMRRLGLTGFHVRCLAYPCHHTGRKTFNELALPDGMVFVDLPRRRRFICDRCGACNFELSLDWRDYHTSGRGRPSDAVDGEDSSP